MTQRIVPSLWFDGTAREAAEFYVSVFADSAITGGETYPDEGLADFQQDLAGADLIVEFSLAGHRFIAINAGPQFRPTGAVSTLVNFDPAFDQDAERHIDEAWARLVEGGQVRLPLGAYPFSRRYGWVEDRFGFHWQLILTNPAGEPRPTMIPALTFAGDVVNRAEEAIDFYAGVFPDSRRGMAARYEQPVGPAHAGSLQFAEFALSGDWFTAMDAPTEQSAPFNEATSFMVSCADQDEIDRFWSQLSAVPAAEACGWCKDRFGLSWQIVPANMDELMTRPDAFAHMMSMKKLVIADF